MNTQQQCNLDKYPPISPNLTVKDINAAINFYEKAFGFKVKFAMKDDDGSIQHAELCYHDSVIMLGPECMKDNITKSPATTKVECPVAFYVYCDDVDKFYQHAINSGAVSVTAPEDMFWGDRLCRLKDLDGYVWGFAVHKKLQKK
jgi:PhnB protein